MINAYNADAHANSKKNCLQERSKGIARETYKNNHFINDTYKLGDINLKFNESFILKNDVKYRKTDCYR